MMTNCPSRIAGKRYASVFPVPVPASTINDAFSSSASSTACAVRPARAEIRRQNLFESKPPGAKNSYSENPAAPVTG